MKDRLTQDGVASKLMSYTFYTEERKGKKGGEGEGREERGSRRHEMLKEIER